MAPKSQSMTSWHLTRTASCKLLKVDLTYSLSLYANDLNFNKKRNDILTMSVDCYFFFFYNSNFCKGTRWLFYLFQNMIGTVRCYIHLRIFKLGFYFCSEWYRMREISKKKKKQWCYIFFYKHKKYIALLQFPRIM